MERDALSGELRTAYVNGHEEQLKLLLNQQDPAQVGRMLTYYGYFGRARAERIGAIREQLTELAALRQQIVAETERLEALEGEQTQQLDALRNAQKARAHAVAAVEGQIKTRSGELRRLESQAGSLEKLITQLRKALESVPVAKQAPFEPLRGKLPWPVQQGRVLARFGQPRAGGSLKWQGMLVGTDRGARVRAPFAGRVVYADWLPGMGLMLVLDHGQGYMSRSARSATASSRATSSRRSGTPGVTTRPPFISRCAAAASPSTRSSGCNGADPDYVQMPPIRFWSCGARRDKVRVPSRSAARGSRMIYVEMQPRGRE